MCPLTAYHDTLSAEMFICSIHSALHQFININKCFLCSLIDVDVIVESRRCCIQDFVNCLWVFILYQCAIIIPSSAQHWSKSLYSEKKNLMHGRDAFRVKREISYEAGTLWNSTLANATNTLALEAAELFRAIDVNSDNRVTRDEFVAGITNAPNVDLFDAEAGRLFDCIDTDGAGFVDNAQFTEVFITSMKKKTMLLLTHSIHFQAAGKMRWLRSLIRLFIAGFEYQFTFVVAKDYDFTKSTTDNYRSQAASFSGPFADIRSSLDYSYHAHYTEARQRWQDQAVRACIGKTDPQTRPWMIFTCGAFGAGKGHVLTWLSHQGLFPLEYIVHIDPDFFKRVMPEWKGYLSNNVEFAGSATHHESGYIQEIATEAALRERQHIWVDGSLKDYVWYTQYFDDVRRRYRHYRIAIIHVTATEEEIRKRIRIRGEQTGRMIPEADIVRSLRDPEISIKVLARQCDLVVRFDNSDGTPKLLSVEDHSGNLQRGLYRHFGVITRQLAPFPQGLGPLFFENTAMIGTPFKKVGDAVSYQPHYPEFEGCLLVKVIHMLVYLFCIVIEIKYSIPGEHCIGMDTLFGEAF